MDLKRKTGNKFTAPTLRVCLRAFVSNIGTESSDVLVSLCAILEACRFFTVFQKDGSTWTWDCKEKQENKFRFRLCMFACVSNVGTESIDALVSLCAILEACRFLFCFPQRWVKTDMDLQRQTGKQIQSPTLCALVCAQLPC